MPNKVNLPSPPVLRGEADANMSMLWSWLFQFTEQLNVCLNQIDEDNLSEGVRGKLNGVFEMVDEIEKVRSSANGMNSTLDRVTRIAIDESGREIAKKIEDSAESIGKDVDARLKDVGVEIGALAKQLKQHDHNEEYAVVGHTHKAADIKDLTIRYGTGQFKRTNAGDTTGIDVEFSEPFPEGVVPCVTLTVHFPPDRYGNMNEDLAPCIALVQEGSVTNTGFKAWFCNGDDNEWFAPTFAYAAISGQ